MSRLPAVTYESADDDQRELWDRIVASRGAGLNLVGGDGALVGPFNSMVTRPGIGAPLSEVGAAVRFASSLEERLLELAICTVGARWKAEFEWYAHSRLAAAAGVEADTLDALAAGERPSFAEDDERVVHSYAASLCAAGHVDQATYEEAERLLGVAALVDLTMTVGYYTQICFVLNAFDVPLPDGVAPVWA